MKAKIEKFDHPYLDAYFDGNVDWSKQVEKLAVLQMCLIIIEKLHTIHIDNGCEPIP